MSGDEDEWEEIRDRITSDELDFSSTNLSEREYETIISRLQSLAGVFAVSRWDVMNEVFLDIVPDYTGTLSQDDLPDERLHIEYATCKDNKECFEVSLSTTKLLCHDREYETFYPGIYDEEAVAYLVAELSLFDEVSEVTFDTHENGQTVVTAALVDPLPSTDIFHDLTVAFGFRIQSIEVVEGQLKSVSFCFSERRVWEPRYAEKYQSEKIRMHAKDLFYTLPTQNLPCGHTASPTIGMLKGLTNDEIVDFPLTTVSEFECYEIPVRDRDSFVYEIDSKEVASDVDSSSTVTTIILPGFCCSECTRYFAVADENSVREAVLPSEIKMSTKTVNLNGNEYSFSLSPFAARTK